MLHNYYGNKFTYNYSIELINPATFEPYLAPPPPPYSNRSIDCLLLQLLIGLLYLIIIYI